MVASLKNTGTFMGKSGSISLKGIYATGSGQTLTGNTGYFGYDRIYTDANNHYKQVNPFEVEAGRAADPTAGVGSYSLLEWDSYLGWVAADAASSNFDLTLIDYTSATFTWATASGYLRNPAELQQLLYVNVCLDPLTCDATVSPTNDVNLGDVITYTVTGLTPNTDYVAAIKTLWDERGTGTALVYSDEASLKSPLTSGSAGLQPDQIYFTTQACPPNCIVVSNQATLTNTNPAFTCLGNVGSTTIYSNDTTLSGINNLSIGDTLFTSRTLCHGSSYICGTVVSQQYVHDGVYWVELNGSGNVISGPNSCL